VKSTTSPTSSISMNRASKGRTCTGSETFSRFLRRASLSGVHTEGGASSLEADDAASISQILFSLIVIDRILSYASRKFYRTGVLLGNDHSPPWHKSFAMCALRAIRYWAGKLAWVASRVVRGWLDRTKKFQFAVRTF